MRGALASFRHRFQIVGPLLILLLAAPPGSRVGFADGGSAEVSPQTKGGGGTPPPSGKGGGTANTFSGQATVVRATVLGLQPIILSDTGPLPSSGGALNTSLLSAQVQGLLTAEVLHASTVGQGNASRSEASVANLGLTVAGNTIAAGFLMSRAVAECHNGVPSQSGSSEIVDLVINGETIAVSGTPNEAIALPGGGSVTINEQDSTRPGDITVNALHVVVPGIADVVISSAHADINCAPPGGGGCVAVGDFVTGGGFITAPSGGRANFAVAGGIKGKGFWGHLEYHDRGANLTVHGTGVTAYVATGPTTRHIEGTALVNGQAGFTYQVDVTDNGEPGTADVFSISLSNGYSAGDTLRGGNIQLHRPNICN
jgi:hypothetical protein